MILIYIILLVVVKNIYLERNFITLETDGNVEGTRMYPLHPFGAASFSKAPPYLLPSNWITKT